VKAIEDALDENGQPVDESDDECSDPAQHDPEKHREREKDPEEHGQPCSVELVVTNDDAAMPSEPLSTADYHGELNRHYSGSITICFPADVFRREG